LTWADAECLIEQSLPPREQVAPSQAAAASAAVADCGTFQLSQGEGLPESAVRCFVEAVQARRPARLMETRPTVEGDPIPVAYIADAGIWWPTARA
jgi:hypothetical protein